jgi:spore germination protein GerM
VMTQRAWRIGIGAIVFAAIGWLLVIGLPRWYTRSRTPTPAARPPAASITTGRKIKVRLFYVAEDGTRLTSVEREVSYGEGAAEQARQIIDAQIAPVAEPLVSAVPAGTMLRAVFVTDHGDAFLDFSRELSVSHTGGSTDELLTVYTLVNAVTVNLPAIHAVQLLVNGTQVDTLAGHIDLRRPIEKDLSWVQ